MIGDVSLYAKCMIWSLAIAIFIVIVVRAICEMIKWKSRYYVPISVIEDVKAEIKEKSNNEIKIGDEVYCEKYGVGAVISIFSYGSIDILTKNDGVFIDIPISGFKKTGRHFYQIAEVLEQMKG